MILKIKRERDVQDWWILDDIRKISISLPRYGYRAENFVNEVADIFLLDNALLENEEPIVPGPGVSEKFEYKQLICRTPKGDEFSIVFDTVAYLCNDEGKTIEKIVGR